MNIMNRLTWKSMVKNRTRTIVTAIGIALSAALFCAVTTMGASILSYLIDLQIAVGGDYHVSAVTLTQEEADAIRNREDVAEAARVLLEKGIRRVFISMGADGVYAATQSQQCWLPNLPGNMVNTTGCGDAFMAALVWAYLEGTDLENTALAGLAAGSIAMESAETINPNMSAEAIRLRMNIK